MIYEHPGKEKEKRPSNAFWWYQTTLRNEKLRLQKSEQ